MQTAICLCLLEVMALRLFATYYKQNLQLLRAAQSCRSCLEHSIETLKLFYLFYKNSKVECKISRCCLTNVLGLVPD